jgi:hemolysin III
MVLELYWRCKYSYPNSTAIKSENMAGIVSRSIWLLFFTTFHFFYTLPWNSAYTSKTHTWNPWSHQYLFLDSRYLHLFYLCINSFGITLLSVLWGLTVLGIIYTIFFLGKWKVFSTLHRNGLYYGWRADILWEYSF